MLNFDDDFVDNRNSWYIRSDNNVETSIKNGYYFEHRCDQGIWLVWHDVNLRSGDSFSIRTRLQRVMGASNSSYGLAWGLSDGGNFNCCLLSSQHPTYYLGRMTNSQWRTFISWSSAPIHTSVGSVNEIMVAIHGNNIRVNINSREVSSLYWDGFNFGGNVGFMLGPTMKVKIERLSVTAGMNAYTNGAVRTGYSLSGPEEDDYGYEEEYDDTYINSRGYRQNSDGEVFIDGHWVDPMEAAAQYEMDDLEDGIVPDDY